MLGAGTNSMINTAVPAYIECVLLGPPSAQFGREGIRVLVGGRSRRFRRFVALGEIAERRCPVFRRVVHRGLPRTRPTAPHADGNIEEMLHRAETEESGGSSAGPASGGVTETGCPPTAGIGADPQRSPKS
jgi:hypothetical protein